MRYTPAAVALSLLAAVTGSMGSARTSDPLDPRAQVLLQDGRALLAKGNVDQATDSLEAALTLDPSNSGILVSLGDAAREAGLQGKAIHYYRTVLEREPNNLSAIAGEGAALAEKGAVEIEDGRQLVDIAEEDETEKRRLPGWLPVNEEKREGLQSLKENLDSRLAKAKNIKNNLKDTELALRIGNKELFTINF